MSVPEFADWIAAVEDPGPRARTAEVLTHLATSFPTLERVIKWKQPMLLDHGTFILGLSVYPKNLAIGPEEVAVAEFSERIKASGYTHTKGLIRVPWSAAVDYDLLDDIVRFNIADKADATGFWR